MTSTKRSATFARLVVVLCTLALLFADVFRGFHLLTERHVVCAEHGELVHAGEAASGGARDPAGPADPVSVDPADPASHHHDHCGVGAFTPKDGQAAVSAPAVVLVSAPSERVAAVAHALSVPRHAVLSYAPKLSPPV